MNKQLKIFYSYSNGKTFFKIIGVNSEEKANEVKDKINYLFPELKLRVKNYLTLGTGQTLVELMDAFHTNKNEVKTIGILNFLYGAGIYVKDKIRKGFVNIHCEKIVLDDLKEGIPLPDTSLKDIITSFDIEVTDKNYNPFMSNQKNSYCEYDYLGNMSVKSITEPEVEQAEKYFEVVDQYTVYGDDNDLEIIVIKTNVITNKDELNRFNDNMSNVLGKHTITVNVGDDNG